MTTSVLSRSLSTTLSRFQSFRNTPLQQDAESASDDMCPICWNDLPSKPMRLPCGHEFCRTCIHDLKRHNDARNETTTCPMCRGPMERPKIKKLWKEFKEHDNAATELVRMQQHETRLANATRLAMEARAVQRRAIAILEECIEATKEDPRNRKKTLQLMCKLIEVVSKARLPDGNSRSIKLLREIIDLSEHPVPQVRLKLAKLLQQCPSSDSLQDAIHQYESILQTARGGAGRARRQSKKLRGAAHYGLARCFHRLGDHKRASKEYDQCEKYKTLEDYRMAAKSHYFSGNHERAMVYASQQLEMESISPSFETLLLMSRICRGYFLSVRSYRRIDALDYQAKCKTYQRCVLQAQTLATRQSDKDECVRHLELLMHLLYPMKKTYYGLVRSASICVTSLEDETEREDEEIGSQSSVEV